MVEPKFLIGDVVHVMGVVNHTVKIVDRLYDPSSARQGGRDGRYGHSGYRYRVEDSPAWFHEEQLETPEEVKARMDDEDEYDLSSYEYDGDTGQAFVNGSWRVVSSTTWEKWKSS